MMSAPRDLLLAVVIGLAVVGCGSAGASSSRQPASQPVGSEPVGASSSPESDVAADRYTCDSPPGFPLSVFDQPAIAELEVSPSGDALRTALTQDLAANRFPRSGYWLVGRGPARADYVARSDAGNAPFVYASLEIHDGVWTLSGFGECRPSLVLEGRSLATWTLDPDSPAPNDRATSFAALVTERSCTGGRAMGERLLPPTITYLPDTVGVVFSARPLAGGQDCPGNPSTRVVVELREPLGKRRLVDGAFFPPADPSAPAT
jgi:hypothetical protein